MPEAKADAAPLSPTKASKASRVTSSKYRSPFVLNYSFLEIADLEDLPTKLSVAAPPREPKAGEGDKKRRIKCTSIRLSNNNIENIDRGATTPLDVALAEVVADISAVKWIDLSFNAIGRLDTALDNFVSLSVLNLHSNHIAEFAQLKPLARLRNLRSLTLHGNPIEEKKHYRTYVIHLLKGLNQLDFSSITKMDRALAEAWAFTFRNKLAHKKRDDEFD